MPGHHVPLPSTAKVPGHHLPLPSTAKVPEHAYASIRLYWRPVPLPYTSVRRYTNRLLSWYTCNHQHSSRNTILSPRFSTSTSLVHKGTMRGYGDLPRRKVTFERSTCNILAFWLKCKALGNLEVNDYGGDCCCFCCRRCCCYVHTLILLLVVMMMVVIRHLMCVIPTTATKTTTTTETKIYVYTTATTIYIYIYTTTTQTTTNTTATTTTTRAPW